MQSWSDPDVPPLPGTGRPLRLYDTADRRDPADRARARPPGSTSAASPPTTPPTSATPRPTWPSTWCSGSGWTPATGCTTCRTSPTSTTRCWSGPPPPAWTGPSWPSARPSCSAQDMASLRVLPPQRLRRRRRVGGRDRRRGGQAAGRRQGLPAGRRHLRHASPAAATSATNPVTPPSEMLTLSAERGGDPDRPGKRDPLDALLWRGRRDRRAVLGRRRSGRAGRAGTSSARRSRATGWAWASTCRAAARTCAFRTTSTRPRTPRR